VRQSSLNTAAKGWNQPIVTNPQHYVFLSVKREVAISNIFKGIRTIPVGKANKRDVHTELLRLGLFCEGLGILARKWDNTFSETEEFSLYYLVLH